MLVNHVACRSGELHDLRSLTADVHRAVGRAVWEVRHSAGALRVEADRTTRP